MKVSNDFFIILKYLIIPVCKFTLNPVILVHHHIVFGTNSQYAKFISSSTENTICFPDNSAQYTDDLQEIVSPVRKDKKLLF
jgi:hypothetical protein